MAQRMREHFADLSRRNDFNLLALDLYEFQSIDRILGQESFFDSKIEKSSQVPQDKVSTARHNRINQRLESSVIDVAYHLLMQRWEPVAGLPKRGKGPLIPIRLCGQILRTQFAKGYCLRSPLMQLKI